VELAVHQQRSPLLGEHLQLEQGRRVAVAHREPSVMVRAIVHPGPLDRRVAKQDPESACRR